MEEFPLEKSLYRRPLPSKCIDIASVEGRKLFASALASNGIETFFPLISCFTHQDEPAFCGLTTLVICLNSLGVDPKRMWKGPWRWYTESHLSCCVPIDVVKQRGVTFDEFVCLSSCNGLIVSAKRPSRPEKKKLELLEEMQAFRELVVAVCSGSTAGRLVCSYNRGSLGQTGTGHFSPIAGYDKDSDSVLILDTAQFKYPPHFVKLPLLFEAMRTLDPDTNLPRGYILLQRAAEFGEETSFAIGAPLNSDWKVFSQKFEEFLLIPPRANSAQEFLSQLLAQVPKELLGSSDWIRIFETSDRDAIGQIRLELENSDLYKLAEKSVFVRKCQSCGCCDPPTLATLFILAVGTEIVSLAPDTLKQELSDLLYITERESMLFKELRGIRRTVAELRKNSKNIVRVHQS